MTNLQKCHPSCRWKWPPLWPSLGLYPSQGPIRWGGNVHWRSPNHHLEAWDQVKFPRKHTVLFIWNYFINPFYCTNVNQKYFLDMFRSLNLISQLILPANGQYWLMGGTSNDRFESPNPSAPGCPSISPNCKVSCRGGLF